MHPRKKNCKHILQEPTGSAEKSLHCKCNHWRQFWLQRKTPLSIQVSKYQSFSKLEVGTLLADPGCWGTATAGSLAGRCCWGMGRCGHWRGLYTPGQTHWPLGDISQMRKRSGTPVKINHNQQANLHRDFLKKTKQTNTQKPFQSTPCVL